MKPGDIVSISETGKIYSGISESGQKYGVIVSEDDIYVGFSETRKMWKVFVEGKVEMFYQEDLEKAI